MDYETAADIWHQLQKSHLIDLREALVDVAVRYARMRADYYLADVEERRELDSARTLCHNALISSCDVLARNMAQNGENASWRQRLGNDRKVIGDFACHLHAVLGIAAR